MYADIYPFLSLRTRQILRHPLGWENADERKRHGNLDGRSVRGAENPGPYRTRHHRSWPEHLFDLRRYLPLPNNQDARSRRNG